MLYAPLSREGKWEIPMAWDKVDAMFKHLNKMVWGYQLQMERKMFAIEGAEFRATLIRWESNSITRDNKRVVLVTTSEPSHMESVLLVLIREAETNAKQQIQI